MPKEIEIIPPSRVEVSKPKPVTVTASVPTLYRGGPIASRIDEWVWNKQSRALDALTRVNASEAALLERQTAVILNKTRRDDALFALQEAPERRGHELALRRVQRANEVREYQHHYEVSEIRRSEERTHADAKLVHARAALTDARTVHKDAEQRYESQCEHGKRTYDIKHKRQQLEDLDIKLEENERRLYMRKQLRELEEPEYERDDDDTEQEIDDALYARRDQLNAAGLDTTRVEKVISVRKVRK